MNRKEYRAAMDAVHFRADFQQQTIEKLTAAAAHQTGKGSTMKSRKIAKTVPIAAVLTVVLAITALAVTVFLRPSEVASELQDQTLAEAFEGQDAVVLNKTVESGAYKITLEGVVSGSGLSDYCQEVDTGRTYAVVSVSRSDGTAMDEVDGDLVMTPLISGYAPWAVNAWTLGGGFQAFTKNGTAYYLFDYQSLEMFANHTVYLAVYQGNAPSSDDFDMAADGTISFTKSFQSPHALFTLPMDPSKADDAAVEQYFQEQGIDKMLNPAA